MSIEQALREAITKSDYSIVELKKRVDVGSFIPEHRKEDEQALILEQGFNLGLRHALNIVLAK